jgi:hypothetical protein
MLGNNRFDATSVEPVFLAARSRRSTDPSTLATDQTMKRCALQLVWCGFTMAFASCVLAHDCRVTDPYLRGSYEGECDKTETAHGQGEAKGADAYVGEFVKGKPEGKGVYTWQKGGRLEGTFKAGKADGPGVYTAAGGTRYDGPFENGKLKGSNPGDCPATPGPLNC